MNRKMNLTKIIMLSLLLLTVQACDALSGVATEIRRVGDIHLGTGHSAHELCSRIFVSGQDRDLIIEDVLVQKVYPLQWIWAIDIDEEKKTVSVGAPFFTAFNNATAVYRKGQGCTMANGVDLAELQAQAIKPVNAAFTLPEDMYWPEGRLGVYAEQGTYDMDLIQAAMDEMFTEFSTDRFEQINTYAVLVVHDGRLIAERYESRHNKDTRFLGWSISKTVTALLLGILAGEGKVSLDDVVNLEKVPDGKVRLRHVLNMASGLDFNEGYEGQSDISDMLYVVSDASAYAKSRPLIHEPGSHFNYSTGDTQILSDIVQTMVGGTAQAAHEFYQGALFHKLFIDSAVVEHDAAGTFIGGARMFMKPRDWARLGLLMLNEGQLGEEQIVPREWVKAMLTPSSAYDGYGGQVWLYERELFGDKLPEDAYALWGVLGQLIVVVPSHDLVVLRFGANGGALSEDLEGQTVFRPVGNMLRGLPRPAMP